MREQISQWLDDHEGEPFDPARLSAEILAADITHRELDSDLRNL